MASSGGRPKIVIDIRDLARQHSETAVATLVSIAENGKQESARVAASIALLDRGWGRATTVVAGDENAPPIGLSIVDQEAEIERRRAEARRLLSEAFGRGGSGGNVE